MEVTFVLSVIELSQKIKELTVQTNNQIARLETIKRECNLAKEVIFSRRTNKENVSSEVKHIAP